jgi:cytochrome c553
VKTEGSSPRSRSGTYVLAGSLMMIGATQVLAEPTTPSAAKAAAESPLPPCEACHGAHGEGMAAAHVPRIAGQSAEYLKKQLDDYAEGTRDNPIMRNFARALSEKQRSQFAVQYAAMLAPSGREDTAVNGAQLARGHQLAYQGDEQRRVQACDGCHGPDGTGVLHAAPYIAGQSADYLASALKAFRDGTRKNDAGELMRSVAMQLDAADIAALSTYFSSVSFPANEKSRAAARAN